MSNIVKVETKDEAVKQLVFIDRSLADTIMRRLDIEERKKELNAKIRSSKEYEELRTLSKEDRELVVVQHEKTGARKMMYHLLAKFGVKVPETKLTRLAQSNDNVRHLVEAR